METPDHKKNKEVFEALKNAKLTTPPPLPDGKGGSEKMPFSRRNNLPPPPNKRKRYLKFASGAVALLFLLLIWGFFMPRNGTIHYGICKVFAERYVAFPTTMRVRDVEYFGLTVRVFATHTDASGQYRYDQFLCEFDGESLNIQGVQINRKPVAEEVVKDFNKGLDAILLNPPDLTLPPRISELSIKELWHGEY